MPPKWDWSAWRRTPLAGACSHRWSRPAFCPAVAPRAGGGQQRRRGSGACNRRRAGGHGSGKKQNADDRAALVRLRLIQETREQVIELLERTPFGRADLAAIRDVVTALEASAGLAEEQAAREDTVGGDSAAMRRVGSVWLEMKYIPDSASGRTYGPYIYFWQVPARAVQGTATGKRIK